ncbi:MAG: hypothetical protein QNK42_00030, partial [Pseudodonghicola sp.]|nr:hypothetical protein [Pseudodonghicola sp.]
RPESGDQIAQTFGAGFHEEFGIAPPGPGYLFSLSVHRDTVILTPPMPDIPGVATTGLIATEAGAIWCPEGWALRRTDIAYLLERSPS